MEALLRQRPPPDRYQPGETAPEAIATGKIVKYREKKPKKNDKNTEVKGPKKTKKPKATEEAVVIQSSEAATPILVVPTIPKETCKAIDLKKLSTATASITMPTATSKRKRDAKEKSSKSYSKKSRYHDVKARGRSRSRGPGKSHGKRVRSPSPSSESDLKTLDSETSSDESSDSTDSEEKRRRRRRARSKSRGRQRAKSRGRSRSRARYSSDDSNSDSESDSDDIEEEEPIFMAFTVPGGRTHMRPIKRGSTYLKLLDTVYSTSNISQAIKLDLSYELNGMTLQLSDDEDLKALLAASMFTKEMIRVQVEKAAPSPPTLTAPAVIEVGTPAISATSSAKADKGPDRKKRRALEKAKKNNEAQSQPAKADGGKISTQADLPPAAITATNGATSKEAITANDSVVSLDTSEDIPLAKVVFKNSAAPSKFSEPATAGEASKGEAVEKPKRKRRSPEQILADKLADEARKEAVKVEKEEKKAAKLAENRKKAKEEREAKAAAENATSKPKAQPAISVDIPIQTPAAKTAEQSPTKPAETTPGDKTVDVTPKDDTASTTTKKKSPKKSAMTEGNEKETVEPASATPKVKRAKKSSKEESTPAKEPEKEAEPAKESEPVQKDTSPSKKSAKSNGIDSSKDKISPSKAQKCEICFEKGHSKPYCPIITAGREAVQGRYDELKAKKNKKTKAENEACKTLQGWLKAEKTHQEQELRFSQNGSKLLMYRDKTGKIVAGYASESEKREDQEEQRLMSAALEREAKRRIEEASLSPGVGRNGINDITNKIQQDRKRMAARGSLDPLVVPGLRLGSPAKQSSLEVDQLASSSPTRSESELATSPMLMAGQNHINGNIEAVTLPLAVEEETKSNGSSDTSDDSSGESEEEDQIEDDAPELRLDRDRSESISSSKSQVENNEIEDEVDEIEATPMQAKSTKAPKPSWVASIGSLVGFGGGSQDSQSADPESNNKNAIQAPPSGQRVRQLQDTPVMSSTPVNRRGRPPVGGARLSQLDTSAIKSSYSQSNTPRNSGASPSSKKQKAVSPPKEKLVQDSDSDDSDSDSDHDTKGASMPKAKLAGKKQSKPRTSMLAKMTTS